MVQIVCAACINLTTHYEHTLKLIVSLHFIYWSQKSSAGEVIGGATITSKSTNIYFSPKYNQKYVRYYLFIIINNYNLKSKINYTVCSEVYCFVVVFIICGQFFFGVCCVAEQSSACRRSPSTKQFRVYPSTSQSGTLHVIFTDSCVPPSTTRVSLKHLPFMVS